MGGWIPDERAFVKTVPSTYLHWPLVGVECGMYKHTFSPPSSTTNFMLHWLEVVPFATGEAEQVLYLFSILKKIRDRNMITLTI